VNVPKPVRRGLEILLWVGVLSFAAYRLGPQLGAALGVGGGGTPAPDVSVETLEGTLISLEELRGQVVLVNFWAAWCGPCRLEMPGFQDVYDDYRHQGFTILGISRDAPESEARVRAFLREKDITYPVAMEAGPGARSLSGFGEFDALPTSFLLDRSGRIRHRVTGIFFEPSLRMAVKSLLKEGPRLDTGS
jgi:peroxiredoxin